MMKRTEIQNRKYLFDFEMKRFSYVYSFGGHPGIQMYTVKLTLHLGFTKQSDLYIENKNLQETFFSQKMGDGVLYSVRWKKETLRCLSQ